MKRHRASRGILVAIGLGLIAAVAIAAPAARQLPALFDREVSTADLSAADPATSTPMVLGPASEREESPSASTRGQASSVKDKTKDKPQKDEDTADPDDPATPSDPGVPSTPVTTAPSPDPEPPALPGTVGLVACVSADMEDVLTFTAPDGGGSPDLFVLSASDVAEGPYSVVATASAEARSFTVRVGEPGRAYYKIAARNASGTGEACAPVDNGHVSMARIVGADGATLRSSNGEIVLVLPSGAFDSSTTVAVEEISGTPVGGIISLAGIYEITPSGTLGSPARLSIAYTLAVTHAQVSDTLLRAASLMTYDASTRAWVSGATDNIAAGGFITGTVAHFSEWTPGTLQPHGTSGQAVDYCSGVCHDLLTYPGSTTRYSSRDPQVCYNCHGSPSGTGDPVGAPGENVQAAILGASSLSSHPVVLGGLYCTACHDPHASPMTAPGLLRAWDPVTGRNVVSAGGSTPGEAFCWTCHGSVNNRRTDYLVKDYYLRTGGDKKTFLAGTGHATIDVPGTSTVCAVCHKSHGSSASSLVTTGTVDGRSVVGNDQSLCLACHEVGLGAYSGEALYAQTKHATVAASGVASTTVSASSAAAGACQQCHDPHGTENSDYLRTSGRGVCTQCHDAAGVAYPATYSYQGVSEFDGSGHAGIAGLSYVSLNASSNGFAAWESRVMPTPATPGTPISDESRLAALPTLDGSRLRTVIDGTTGSTDYQMFRFKMPIASSDIVSAKLMWAGYGEETAGYPVTLSIWLPASSTWETVTERVIGTQQVVNATVRAADHIDSDGYVYFLAKAVHVVDEQLVSGPTFTKLSDTSIRVDWVTAGNTTSWVDYGLTASYGTSAGTAGRTTNHSVTIEGLSVGTWHFRVRSVSGEGGAYTSADYAYAFPTPTLITPLDSTSYQWVGTPIDQTFTWQQIAGSTGPYEYRFYLYQGHDGGVLVADSGWTTATTSAYQFTTTGYWSWRVEARDAAGISHGSSLWRHVSVYVPSGSCPFLFTWNGERFAFEVDLFGPGKLALKTKSGYAKPTPDDVYVLQNEPVPVDGRIDLRLVEERFETDYLDQLKLYAMDVPENRDVYAEKREAGGAAFPGVPGVLHTVGTELSAPLASEHVQTGADVSAFIGANDGQYLVLNEDRNRDFTYQTIELDLGDVADAPQLKIVMDAVSMFPTTAEGAAYAASFGSRTKLEVQDASGTWVSVPVSAGVLPKPPEFSRPYAFDISDIWVSDSRKVRFTFLMKTYVDWIAVDTTEDLPVSVTEVPLMSATLSERGYDAASSNEEIYEYVYGEPTGRTGYFPGAYTRLGEVSPLLAGVDDKFVIFGGGDEIRLSFAAPEPASDGTVRRYVIHTNGYYKDTKTDIDETVEPLPFAAMSNFPYGSGEQYPDDDEHREYLREWNTRLKAPAVVTGHERTEQSIGTWLESLAMSFLERIESQQRGFEVSIEQYPVDHRSLNTDVVLIDVSVQSAGIGGECGACHNPHGAAENGVPLTGGRLASDGRLCTADGTGGCHDSAANSATGADIRAQFTASSDVRSHHDVLVTDQAATGARIACADCHNPHTNAAGTSYSDPDLISSTPRSPLESTIDGSGSVYLLVGAAHDGTGPVITGITLSAVGSAYADPRVTWTTDEPATSWIDWGLTTGYELGSESGGAPFGNSVLAISHSVQMTGLVPGTLYHYRVRTTDAMGNTTYSEDRTYRPIMPPPAPTMTDLVTISGTGWGPIGTTLSSSSVTSSDGHAVQYQFRVNSSATLVSGWLDSPSFLTPAWFYTGTYYAQVRARDAVDTNAVSEWSATDYFNVVSADDPGSCPFLFVDDGQGWAFEADLMTAGRVGGPTSSGYQQPNPNDAYVLKNAPDISEGTMDFRLVEERFETDYIDSFLLYAVDAPAGASLYAQKAVAGTRAFPPLGSAVHTVRAAGPPLSVVRTDTGVDVSQDVAADDSIYLELNEDRESGFTYKSLEIDLGQEALSAPQVKVVMDAVTEFPVTEEGIQRRFTFGLPTKLEVERTDGTWEVIPSTLGAVPVAPEFPRPYVFDLTKAIAGSTGRVRFTYLFRTLIDSIQVDFTADEPLTITQVPLVSAELQQHGVDKETGNPGESYFEYGVDLRPGSFFPGAYTRYGEVTDLLGARDDKFVVMGQGDEIALTYQALPAETDGAVRWYVFSPYGYYKDMKTDLPKTVEPLPFAAMSNYPYADEEHYPDDPEHTAYLDDYNTRIVEFAEGIAGQQSNVESSASEWRTAHVDQSVYAAQQFSIDSDRVFLRTDSGSTVTLLAPSAGWESQLPAGVKPTPGAPGAPVDATTLGMLAVSDNAYWRTSLAVAEGNWNWQVIRFDIDPAAVSQLDGITLAWEGHGEPTPGHPVALYVWDPVSSTWAVFESRQAASDTSVGTAVSRIASSYCLTCHDGAPPSGVVLGSITNVGATWNLTTTDFHGGKSGTGVGGTLAVGYTRGSSVPCATCHDTHGSASVYHFPSSVNGKSLPVISGTNSRELCLSCHVGSISQLHSGVGSCNSCHGQYFDDHSYACPSLDVVVVNCLDCHKHGKSWTHPSSNPGGFYCWGCVGDHGGPPSGVPAF